MPKEVLFKIWITTFMFTTMCLGAMMRVGHII